MADLTGHIIKDRFDPFRRVENSFYETQPLDTKVGREYITGEAEVIYYVDKRTEQLKAKETMLYL